MLFALTLDHIGNAFLYFDLRKNASALYPTFLTPLMGMCYEYSTKGRYKFNHTKSGVVTYGETKSVHSVEMKEREWILGDGTVDELYEYKNLVS